MGPLKIFYPKSTTSASVTSIICGPLSLAAFVFQSCESHLTPAWWMTFLSSPGQEVFYGALPPWKALAHFDASALAAHSWQGQKAGAVYHPAASPAFPGWIYQLLADGPWHLLICDDHHKPYIIKCHTPALARVRNWSNARHGSGSK